MNDKPIIVSFYTPEYKELAQRLIDGCKRFGLRHFVDEQRSKGSWQRNCAYKSEFVSMCCLYYKCPVIWIDADATLEQNPMPYFEQLQSQNVDVAVRMSNTNPPHPWNRVMSGTVYFGRSAVVADVLLKWKELCTKDPLTWDQVHLANAMDFASYNDKERLDVFCGVIGSSIGANYVDLPEPYCAVMDRRTSDVPAVIGHWQASRTLKNKVGDES